MWINKMWINKINKMIYPCNGILYGIKKKCSNDTHYNMDEL